MKRLRGSMDLPALIAERDRLAATCNRLADTCDLLERGRRDVEDYSASKTSEIARLSAIVDAIPDDAVDILLFLADRADDLSCRDCTVASCPDSDDRMCIVAGRKARAWAEKLAKVWH